MKQWIKDLYIQALKVAPNKNIKYLNAYPMYNTVLYILSSTESNGYPVQRFINSLNYSAIKEYK